MENIINNKTNPVYPAQAPAQAQDYVNAAQQKANAPAEMVQQFQQLWERVVGQFQDIDMSSVADNARDAEKAHAGPTLNAPNNPSVAADKAWLKLFSVSEYVKSILPEEVQRALEGLQANRAQYQQLLSEYDSAAKAFAQGGEQLKPLAEHWQQAQQAQDDSQLKLDGLKKRLAQEPNNADLKQQVAGAELALQGKQAALQQAQDVFMQQDAELQVQSQRVVGLGSQLKDAAAAAKLRTSPPPPSGDQDFATGLEAVVFLFASLSKAINTANNRDFHKRMEMWKQEQQAVQKDMLEKAEAHAKEVAKQAAASKGSSCAMAIVGVFLGIASVLAAVVTGGASVPAMVGLIVGVVAGLASTAVAVTDLVRVAQGKPTLSSQIFKPLTDLIQTIVTKLGDVLSKVLESFGVPPDKAKQVGHILGAVLVGVALLVMTVVSVVVLKKVPVSALLKSFGSMIGSTVSKILPDLLTSGVTELATNVMSRLAASSSLQAMARMAQTTVYVTGVGEGLVGGGMGVGMNAWKIETAKLERLLEQIQNALQTNTDLQKVLVEFFSQVSARVNDWMSSMFGAIDVEGQTVSAMSRQATDSASWA